MKKLIFLPFFLLLINYSYSQPFGGNNAVWYYDFYEVWGPPYYHSPIIIISSPVDTVNGIAYYTLTRNDSLAVDCSFVPLTDTVFERNDSVYYYLSSTNRYTMLYNWNALAGDTEKIYVENIPNGEDSVMIIIDSISTMNINGFTKKVFHITNIPLFPYHFIFEGDIIEDIGSTTFLFPQYAFCDPLAGGLRCYYDTIIGLYQPWMPGSECDSVIYLGENELNYTFNISIYPNPANDYISISITQPVQKVLYVQLYDLYGQPLNFSKVPNFGKVGNSNELKLSLKEYPAGIYFIKMNIDGKEEMKKVVKLKY